MGEPTSWPKPIHCPSRNDGRHWIDHDLNAIGHSDTVHNTGDLMWTAFWSWLESTLRALRTIEAIEPRARLPHPEDPSRSLDLGLVDPTAVAVVIGYAQNHKRHAPAAYIGFVAQQPHTTWRGLSGFYLLWCGICDPDGEQTFRQLKIRLAAQGVTVKWIGDLHPALLPKPGWFDGKEDGRLIYGALVNPHPELSPIWLTDLETVPGEHTAALIAIAPPVLDTGTLVLVDDLVRDTPTLRKLTGHNGRWTLRPGTPSALRKLAGLGPPTPPRTTMATHPAAIPSTWGSWESTDDHTVTGPVPNLRNAVRAIFPTPHQPGRTSVRIAHLPPGRPVRLADIEALTPALSTGSHPRVID